ncbi:hypothetical protein N9P69_01700 [Gammaproteobacteria bacterium]|nr:hypothetical protein [Gammaproteobacteria bacterium]|tara:strand:- start:2362 stop:4836 length:2475 start_codon:yes stop_codon:yes gene_type:complete
MAIERMTSDPVDMTTSQSTDDQLDNEIIEVLEDFQESDVTMQEDGSALLGPEPDEQVTTTFNENLADVVSDSELAKIYIDLTSAIDSDRSSREDWEKTYTDGLKYLGMKFDETRSEPFEGASGVTHPLLGEAVTQFQAQAYKELLPAGGPVKTQVVGAYDSAVEEQAQRVREFMNYEILHVMEEYDEDLDQMLFYLPLAGSAFKKVYYDENLQRPVSKFVAPEDLIVPYYTTDLESCPRITHVIKMPENDIRKLQAIGFYKKFDMQPDDDANDYSSLNTEKEKLEGMEPSYDTGEVCMLYEIHCNLDLEGFEDVDENGEESGVKLPYIVTIDSNTENVLSIRRNFLEEDPMRNKIEYFVHFKFLPGLGFYGFGLSHMIGGLSKASTSILRQLIDAGTLANLPAGFKTRGIRIRNEDEPIQPGEFRDVDAPAGSLRDAIQPLPFKEPSATLLNLLGLLVSSGQRFASIAEIAVGEGNSQAPVGTTLALMEKSTKVLSAIHKRLHNAQKKEFSLLAKIFSDSLPPTYPYQVSGGQNEIKQSDFDGKVDIFPVSNPDIFSTSQRIVMAQEMMQLVQSNPDIHGPGGVYEAYRRMYSSLGVDNIDSLLLPPPPSEPSPIEAGMENSTLLMGGQAEAFPQQNHDAHIASHASLLSLQPVQVNPQVQANIISHIMQHLQLKADAIAQQQMPPEAMQQYQQLQQQAQQVNPVEARQLNTQANDILAQFSAPIMTELMTQFSQQIGTPQEEDPLVTIRKQELALKGQQLNQEQQQFVAREQQRSMEQTQQDTIDRERIDAMRDIAIMKDETTKDRLDQQKELKLIDIGLKEL